MRIVSFDGVTFGRQNEQDSIPLETVEALQEIPGADGAFDALGDDQIRRPVTFSRSFLLTGTAIHTELDAIRAKTNRRGWLTLQTRGGDNRGVWAKLTNVSYDNTPEQVNYLPVKLTFSIPWPWLQTVTDGWYLDAGYVLDTSGLYLDGNYTARNGAGTMSINNTGGGPITRGLITIAGASTNPAITNAANNWTFAYTGSIPAGQVLFIDTGAQSVTLGGSSVWTNVTLGSNQTGIMQLETGVNRITFSGGGSITWHWARVY